MKKISTKKGSTKQSSEKNTLVKVRELTGPQSAEVFAGGIVLSE